MTPGLHTKPAVVKAALNLLLQMQDAASSLSYAALLTDDGFDVARLPGEIEGEKFAGMASSMQALSDAVAHELKIGDSEYVIIASPKGYVVQLRVPGQELVLSALFDSDSTIGSALAVTRTFAQKMADLLR
jgi:predicted regulator of Ras-like GTPase activity (Roadblock/LC7/MglB family)